MRQVATIKLSLKRAALLSIGTAFITGVGWFAFKSVSDQSGEPPDLANGKQAYVENCMTCHGAKGHGDGPASSAMQIKPDNIYQELTNPFGLKAELIDSVLTGDNGQDGTMPAFNAVLDAREINDIFGYIVSINQTFH